MELCGRCRKKPVLGSSQFCASCLPGIVERRVKKEISAFSGKQLIVDCLVKNCLGCVAARHILGKSSIVKKSSKNAILVVPLCADDAAAGFVEALASKRHKQPHSQAIRLFESVTEADLAAYAGIKNLKYAAAKGEGSYFKESIQKLQESHPGTVEGLVQSGKKLRDLI